jgi:ribokinase
MSAEILVIGSMNMDLVVSTDRRPNVGETILGNTFSTYPGGKGANQAVAAARLGAQVRMIGCVGQDDFGDTLLQNFQNNYVDTTYVKRSQTRETGIALITVDRDGENSIIVIPGANHNLQPDDLNQLESEFTPAGILLIQLEIPLAVVVHAIRLGHKHKMSIILNPAPAQPLPDDLYPLLDYLIPNESELSLLTGCPDVGEAAIRSCAVLLRDKGLRNLLLTRGEAGTWLFTPKREAQLGAFPVQVVDTTAAGDAFIGGFATALAEGQSVDKAIRFGSAAGALAVTRPGAQTSLPNRAEVDQFLLRQTT